jgi:hypothetical protein
MTEKIIHNGVEFVDWDDSSAEAMAAFERGRQLYADNIVALAPYVKRRAAEMDAKGKGVRLDVDLGRLSEDNITDMCVYLKTLELEAQANEDAADGESLLEPGEEPGSLLEAELAALPCPFDASNADLDGCFGNLERKRHAEIERRDSGLPRPARRFRRFTHSDHSLQMSGAWLVKGVLPAHGLNTIIGASGAGKTFLVLDILLHIALGWPWRGLRTRKCPVTCIAAEAGVMAQNRIIGWCRHHGVPWPENFHLIAENVNLFVSNADALAIIEDIRINQPGCGLVVVDTLARAMTGGNEREGRDMGVLIGHAEQIASELGAAVYLIHHTGKDAARGARGASELPGAVNFEGTAMREREQGAIGTFKVTKQRDGVTGTEFQYELKDVELGHDDDGDRVTTAVAVEPPVTSDASPPGTSTGNGRKMGSNQKAAAKAFSQYVEAHGVRSPGGVGFPPGTMLIVDRDAFTQFAAGKLGDTPAENLKTMKRVVQGLVDQGFLAVNGGRLWQPSFTKGKV